MNSEQVAREIYNYLKQEIPNLPHFSFQLNTEGNCSITFTELQDKQRLYYCYIPFKYELRYFDSKGNHKKQYDTMNKIVEILCSETFAKFKTKTFEIKLVMVNDKPSPKKENIGLYLENWTDSSQLYALTLELHLHILEEKNENNK